MTPRWPQGPDRPQPPRDEVHVWRADLAAPGPGPDGLPAPERERAERFLNPAAGARWIAARWALRGVLGRYLDEEPAAIELAFGEHGKPRLARAPERLSFNLSHSGTLALLAVAVGTEVGVDVEQVKPERDVLALAARGLDPGAAAEVRAAPAKERAAVFFPLWSEHEARLKCIGTGIGCAPEEEVPVSVRQLDLGPAYASALAVASEQMPPCHCYRLVNPF